RVDVLRRGCRIRIVPRAADSLSSQRIGRPLAEERRVRGGKPTELEEAVVGRDARDGRLAGPRLDQRVANGLHPPAREIALRARAVDGMAGVAQAPLAHTAARA